MRRLAGGRSRFVGMFHALRFHLPRLQVLRLHALVFHVLRFKVLRFHPPRIQVLWFHALGLQVLGLQVLMFQALGLQVLRFIVPGLKVPGIRIGRISTGAGGGTLPVNRLLQVVALPSRSGRRNEIIFGNNRPGIHPGSGGGKVCGGRPLVVL